MNTSKLLIIDDNVELTTVLKFKLERLGYRCEVLNEGKYAFEKIKEHRPDLIILDVMMNDLSGFEICRRIRRDPNLYDIPIIAISAMREESEVLHGLHQGIDRYIGKPFEFNELADEIRATLQRHKQVKETNPVTGLPGNEALKRLIARSISRGERFVLSYFEVDNLRNLIAAYGEPARESAERMMAQLLHGVAEEFKLYEFTCAHLGGGCFAAVMHIEDADRYVRIVNERFESQLPELYNQLGAADAYRRGKSSGIAEHKRLLLKLLVCVTSTENRSYHTAQEMFNVISQLRRKVLSSPAAPIIFDQRTW